jgi:hypothetical protein
MAERPLTHIEVAEARLVFGAGLNYARVHIVENTPLPNWIADLGRSPKPNSVTLGNLSLFPLALRTLTADIAAGDLNDMGWLIHELAHQWQFQRLGWSYLPRAMRVQLREGMKGYRYQLAADRRLFEFNLEQQGDIARDYYAAFKRGQDVNLWEPLIAELRAGAYR